MQFFILFIEHFYGAYYVLAIFYVLKKKFSPGLIPVTTLESRHYYSTISQMGAVGRIVMSPEDVHILTPVICKYFALHVKKGL